MGSAGRWPAVFGGPPNTSSNYFVPHQTVWRNLVERSFRRAAENCTRAACAPHSNCIVPVKKPAGGCFPLPAGEGSRVREKMLPCQRSHSFPENALNSGWPETRVFQFRPHPRSRPRPRNKGESEDEDENDDEEDFIPAVSGQALNTTIRLTPCADRPGCFSACFLDIGVLRVNRFSTGMAPAAARPAGDVVLPYRKTISPTSAVVPSCGGTIPSLGETISTLGEMISPSKEMTAPLGPAIRQVTKSFPQLGKSPPQLTKPFPHMGK
jgi:hypothetical protein